MTNSDLMTLLNYTFLLDIFILIICLEPNFSSTNLPISSPFFTILHHQSGLIDIPPICDTHARHKTYA